MDSHAAAPPAAAPEAPPDAAPDAPPDAPPAALTDLIAARLVSHEAIGDPERLGTEAETLRVLCALVAGPLWRIAPFHYAFRAQPGDLRGQLGNRAPADWTGALEAALQAELGLDAIWLSPADILSETRADLDQPLLLIAQADAVTEGLRAAAPGTQAVIHARYAAEVARLTTAAGAGTELARRLAAIEARQDDIRETLAARGEDGAALARLGAMLEAALRRLDTQAEQLEALGRRLAELAEAGGAGEFQETLGLTLAEFLARLERQSERATRAHVPHFS